MRRGPSLVLLTCILILTASGSLVPRAQAQSEAACGVVDGVSFPFENVASGGYYVRFEFGYPREGWGFHSGEDWFNSQGNAFGDPVRAIADGLVTYSSRYGWGVDKGVVIVEHTLREGAVIYSVYGHMEELNGHTFPQQGDCVQRGQIVGAIGDPRGRPHLHFEIRHKWPTFPGFGYTELPPHLDGFENPTAYIINWQAWLNPAYKWHTVTAEPMTALPALAPDGTIYVATEGYLQSYGPDSILKYRYELGSDEVISHMSADESGVTAYTTEGELRRYQRNLDNTRIQYLGGTYESLVNTGPLIFLHANGATLRVYDRDLVQRAQFQDVGLPQSHAATDELIAVGTGQRSPEVLLFTPQGELLQRATLRSPADLAPAPDGGVYVRSTQALWHVTPDAEWHFVTDAFEVSPNLSALAADGWGSTYLYAGREDRQLLSLGADGQTHWQTSLNETVTTRPAIAVGGGCAVYLGSSDGQLAAVNAATGELGQTLRIYPGDSPGREAWLAVSDDETVYFAVGGDQIIALDGRGLIGLPPGTPCVNPY